MQAFIELLLYPVQIKYQYYLTSAPPASFTSQGAPFTSQLHHARETAALVHGPDHRGSGRSGPHGAGGLRGHAGHHVHCVGRHPQPVVRLRCEAGCGGNPAAQPAFAQHHDTGEGPWPGSGCSPEDLTPHTQVTPTFTAVVQAIVCTAGVWAGRFRLQERREICGLRSAQAGKAGGPAGQGWDAHGARGGTLGDVLPRWTAKQCNKWGLQHQAPGGLAGWLPIPWENKRTKKHNIDEKTTQSRRKKRRNWQLLESYCL